MCVICVTVAGTVLVASQITPIQALSEFTSSQKTLTSFAGTSPNLSSKQRTEIKMFVEKSPEANSAVCTGLTSLGATTVATTRALQRAKAVCDYAKKLRPGLSYVTQIKRTAARNLPGRVMMQLRTPKQNMLPPETTIPNDWTSDPTYTPPSETSDAIDVCRMREVSKSRGMTWAGFPDQGPMTTRTGKVKWALIPIDFPDLKGESNFRSRVDDQMELLSEWFDTVSGGKFKVEWVILDRWVTLPDNSSSYVIPLSVNVNNAANGPKLFLDAMNSADPFFDFTNVQTVNFILPKGQTSIGEGSQGFPWDQVVREYRSNEGPIDSYSIPGQFFDLPGKTYWSYWAHEFGHAIGLPHVGAAKGNLPPFNPWDLMGGQDGPSRELSGWLRFLAGWLDSEQIFCKEASKISSLDLSLVPLSERKKGVKVAMLPLSATKMLIIESRRETKFSCKTTPSRNGVLVYVYDATLGHGENFLIEVRPPNREPQTDSCNTQNFRGTTPNPDFLLRAGDKVSIDGYTIEVTRHESVDKVRVSRNP